MGHCEKSLHGVLSVSSEHGLSLTSAFAYKYRTFQTPLIPGF